MTLEQLVRRLKVMRNEAGGSTALAQQLGVSQTVVSLTINGRTEPQPKLLAALGLERSISYRAVPSPRSPKERQP